MVVEGGRDGELGGRPEYLEKELLDLPGFEAEGGREGGREGSETARERCGLE